MNEWDLVLRGGRVIDPESGLDAVRDVAVAAGRIAAVGTGLPPGPADVDVSGQVVTAGFVDLHSHVNDVGGLRLQALDGVTTALELEAGVTPVAEAYRRGGRAGPAGQLRLLGLLGAGPDGDRRGPARAGRSWARSWPASPIRPGSARPSPPS